MHHSVVRHSTLLEENKMAFQSIHEGSSLRKTLLYGSI